MNDNSTKYIVDVDVGEELYLGNKVLGVHQFNGQDAVIYDYKGVTVTGDHPVFEDAWIKVERSKFAERKGMKLKKIFDLTTENHLILVGGKNGEPVTFKDYQKQIQKPYRPVN